MEAARHYRDTPSGWRSKPTLAPKSNKFSTRWRRQIGCGNSMVLAVGLGSAAGGGFSQWNSNAPGCPRAGGRSPSGSSQICQLHAGLFLRDSMVRRRNDPTRGWQQARPAHRTYEHERRGRHDRRLRDLGVGRRIFIQEARLRAIGAEHYHDQHPFHQLMRDGKLDRAYVISTAGLLPATRFAVDAYVNFVRDRSLLGRWPHFSRHGVDGRALPLLRAARDRLWGGCRCPSFALTDDAGRTDRACALTSDHALLASARREAEEATADFVYRQHSNAAPSLRQLVAQSV